MVRLVIISAALCLLTLGAGHLSAFEISNPYYEKTAWKVWRVDPSPVRISAEKTLAPPPEEARLYPRETPENTEIFLRYKLSPDPNGKYAGIWDDVYSNRDNGHSYISDAWSDDHGNAVSGIRTSIIHFKGGHPHQVGTNFTSQSTTGMGHDIVNNAEKMARMEALFYFANVLVSGPAHISYMRVTKKGARDRYQALQPIFYNSIGSSGSEQDALTKMVLAGGYLDPELKKRLKLHGLYASTMLYIWKAALPYDVPFAHELRHRSIYFSKGDGSSYNKNNNTSLPLTRQAYYYDESAHMRQMIDIAESLSAAPPEALLTVVSDRGVEPVYYLKKTVLVHQKPLKAAKLRVSLEDSFDLDGRPLSFHLQVICGDRNTRIEQVGDRPVYDITVPSNLKLPEGRTSILAVADNGLSPGNPAVINIYRPKREPNALPQISEPPEVTARPGQEVRLELKAYDPELFPVSFYKALGPGRIKGEEYFWHIPEDHPGGVENVVLIASDGTSGNGYNAVNMTVRVLR